MEERAVNDKSIEDTGERMVPAYHKSHMVYGEHIVRYEAVSPLARGKKVLDVACGSGYGSELLSRYASLVVGLDNNQGSVDYANRNYGSGKVSFLVGDAEELAFDNAEFDMVVSFETIEHIKNYQRFLKEIRRVLKPDGLLILSTPNDAEYPTTNEFHVHEFKQSELEKVIKQDFSQVRTYYQGTWLYNALLDKGGVSKEWDRQLRTMHVAPIDPKNAVYFVMLCANRRITESVEPTAAISEHWSERLRLEYEQSVRQHMDKQGDVMRHLENEWKASQEKLAMAEAELDRIKQSKYWPLIVKLANAKNKIQGKKTDGE